MLHISILKLNLKTTIWLLGAILFSCNERREQKSQLQTTDTLQVKFDKFHYAAPIADSFPKYFATEFLLQNPQKNKPVIKTENALSAIRGDTLAFYIDPQLEAFTLILFHSSDQVDTFKLKAFDAPSPKILVKIGSQYHDPNSEINLDRQQSIDFEFEMPERFEYYYPKDCRYEIAEGKAVLQSKKTKKSIPIINNSIDLKELNEGGKLVIQIDSLIRRSYKNDIQLINLDRIEMNYDVKYGG